MNAPKTVEEKIKFDKASEIVKFIKGMEGVAALEPEKLVFSPLLKVARIY